MSLFDQILGKLSQHDDSKEKVIDLSDSSQYPASVLADLDCTFALGDDSENFPYFLKTKWQQPSFHWGWDEITHEKAVESDFLYHAIYAMIIQHRERREAMIGAEGYRFVWKNKDVEPVPGLLSGKQLCEMMNRCLDNLGSIKYINDFEEREESRWGLDPTYEDLMTEMEKDADDRDFNFADRGCGMFYFKNRSYGNKQTYLVNTIQKKVYQMVDSDGDLVGFTKDDIDWDNVNQLEHNYDAKRLQTSYSFGVGDYKDGIACVSWMLYPEGRYFADSDGFGADDNDEVNVKAYIDTECRVLVKFQDMGGKEEQLLNEAYKKLHTV